MTDGFPVTYSILSATALAVQVLPDYGLGDIADCRLHSPGVNDTYRVRTAGDGIYYLRVYRSGYRSRADVGYELDVLNHLHRQGVPVARPLPRHDGSFIRELAAPEGKRYAALFTAAEGKEPSYDEDPEAVAFKYGQAVARLHSALQGFTSQYTRFRIDFDHLIDRPLQNVQPFLCRRSDDWDYVRQFAETVRQQILALPASALEQGVCHGDLHGYHAHIAGDGTISFYDFDFCGYGYRAYDLAIFRWLARREKQEHVRWKPYLRGYLGTRPLSDLDVKAIPLFVCTRYIWHMGLHTENAPDWGYGDLGDAYFDRTLQFLRDLEADRLNQASSNG